ncbi:hypothetical protein ACOMHN_064794 [Nucella lapillus]
MLTVGYTLHLPWLVLSVGSWSLLYFSLRGLQPQRKVEWHCRIITVLHASLITLLSGWCALIQGPWPFTDAGGPNTPLQVVVVTICLGYFFFDFTWCLCFQTEGYPMLLHHFLSICGMLYMLVMGRHGTEMAATICGSELTNPLLQLRWFLKETGRYRTWAGEVVDLLFMTSFFTLRIAVGSVLLYCYFRQSSTDFWGRLGAVCIYLIGWMFWVSIFRYAVYKYGKKYRAWRDSGRQPDHQQSGMNDSEKSSESERLTEERGEGCLSARRGGVVGREVHKQGLSSSCSQEEGVLFHRNNNGGQCLVNKGAVLQNGASSGVGSS